MLANRTPREGRLTLTPMLSDNGRLIGDFTVAKENDERFYIFGSGIAESYHMRWFGAHLPEDSSVAVRALSTGLLGLSIAGPKARDLLSKVTSDDVSNEALPFLSFRRMELGMVPAMVGRISFTGDLGYEIWVSSDYQLALYDLLSEAGAEFDLKPFGLRALDSLRLEKSWGTWAREYRPLYDPFEAGLERFVDEKKNDFIGRDAALKARDGGEERRRLTTFVVDADNADVGGDEPIFQNGKVVGWVTSGGYAHHAEASVALGYVPAEMAGSTDDFSIEILGQERTARIQHEPLFDPKAERMRG